METVGAVLSTIGLALAAWSLWYARLQAQRVSSLRRNEMISLWAFLDRIRTLLLQMENNGLRNGELDESKLDTIKAKVLPQLFKGLCDHYVMLAEFIVQKTPDISMADIDRWEKLNRLKTPWQKSQFVNLVEAAMSVQRAKQRPDGRAGDQDAG